MSSFLKGWVESEHAHESVEARLQRKTMMAKNERRERADRERRQTEMNNKAWSQVYQARAGIFFAVPLH